MPDSDLRAGRTRPGPGSGPVRPRAAAVTAVVAAAVLTAGTACTAPSGPAPGSSPPPPPQETPMNPTDPAAVKATLDGRAASVPDEVAGWAVDPASNLVAVSVVGPRTPAVDRFLAGIDPRLLRIEHVDRPPRTLPGG